MGPDKEQLLLLICGGGSVSLHPECEKYASPDDNSFTEVVIFDFKDQELDINNSVAYMENVRKQFLKYFDIFQPPIVLIEYPTLRFGKIVLPVYIKERFDIFISKYKLENNRMIFLQLTAQIYDFIRHELERWSDPFIMNSMRNFIPEVNQIIYLKRLIQDNDLSQSINLEVSITINSGQTLVFKNQKLIHDYLLRDFSSAEPSDIVPNLSKRIELMPYQNNYKTYFRNKLILALHQFLSQETHITLAPGKKSSRKICKVINEFLNLSGIILKGNNGILVNDEEACIQIIKKTIIDSPIST